MLVQSAAAVANYGIVPLAAAIVSKPVALTAIALFILSSIPTVSAGGGTYAKCFKACMDGAGNAAIVAFPICSVACTPALVF